jgi:hypothetical protein
VLAFAEWLQSTRLSVAIQSVDWVIPLLQSIHIIVIGIVFVSSLMIALRILGRVRADQTIAEVWARFAPWLWGGLAVMAATGLILIIGEPVREFTALSFWLKMALLAITGAVVAILGRSTRSAALAVAQGASEFSAGTKLAAVASIVLWLAIIFLGRAIAYDVEIWGALSPSSSG